MPIFDRLSIRAQLLVLLAAVVLPAAGLVAYAVYDRLEASQRAAERQLLAQAQDMAGRIDVVLLRHADLLSRLAERPDLRALDTRRCDAAIASVASMQVEFEHLALRRRDGELVCASRPLTATAVAVRALPWFRDGLASARFSVGGAYAAPPDGRWVAMLTQPVRDAAGEIGGLLILAVDLQELQRQVLQPPPEAIAVVADRAQHYVMRTLDPDRWIGRPLPAAQQAQLPSRIGALFTLTGVDGVTRLNVGAVVPSSGWQVYAAMPEERVYAGYRVLRGRSLALGAGALALAGLLAWRIGRRIARPIDALAARAAAVAGGGAAAVAEAGGSEVAAAAADLGRLADERERLRAEQALATASWKHLADSARDVVLVVDSRDERIVMANQAALQTYGYTLDELRSMNVAELRTPAARAQVDAHREAASRAHGALYETEHRRKDGSTLPVETSVRALDIGGHLYFQSFIRDVSERKRHEALLAAQGEVLAQVAQGAPLAQTLDRLARLVEAQAPGLRATILLLDDDGVHLRHGAAPSLPRAFVEAIDGAAIGPAAGSCGTAAFQRQPVVSEDIATDARWHDWRALARAHGLRACWSTPIVQPSGQVLGTLAMYLNSPGRPDAAYQRLADLVTHTAAIAIVSDRSARVQRAQLDELLRWQALMVDREERMAALKAELERLRARTGGSPPGGEGHRP